MFFYSVFSQVNDVNTYGNTPLQLACYNGQDVVVSELIERGASVNQVCGFKTPAEFMESEKKKIDVFCCLK